MTDERDELTEGYHRDVDRIKTLSGVTFISP